MFGRPFYLYFCLFLVLYAKNLERYRKGRALGLVLAPNQLRRRLSIEGRSVRPLLLYLYQRLSSELHLYLR
jgi:hypothetical protein